MSKEEGTTRVDQVKEFMRANEIKSVFDPKVREFIRGKWNC